MRTYEDGNSKGDLSTLAAIGGSVGLVAVVLGLLALVVLALAP